MQMHITDPSYILHEKTRQYHWEGQAPLSIKAFFSGQALYSVGSGYYAVDDASYLLVNHDQPYAITIEADTAVESFCLFFEPGFAEEVYRSLSTRPDTLLDEPERLDCAPLHFFERTYRHDDLLSPALFQLRAALDHGIQEQAWLDEQAHDLMRRLLQVHFNVYKEVEALLPTMRVATREELYRRLYQARDYTSALFDTPITLAEMASVASLSPNHFLRMFKLLFQQTPYQYLIAQRLQRAQHLLLHTDRSVTEICFALGFESLGSFSWLFRQRVGCSPTTYRTQKGDFGEAS
ncbi:MAG: AraC family transcriptional regulator [Chloroflexota bacterium]|nr:AraC family transcriptional regulator [Chloroflexota bacterium]